MSYHLHWGKSDHELMLAAITTATKKAVQEENFWDSVGVRAL